MGYSFIYLLYLFLDCHVASLLVGDAGREKYEHGVGAASPDPPLSHSNDQNHS